MDKKLPNQTVGNIGLFYVCYRLSQRGWNVMPTSRNARGIDIIAYNYDASRTRSFQVKALSKRTPVGLGADPRHLVADFVIVCRHVHANEPECFILTGSEAQDKADCKKKNGKDSCWLQPRDYESPEFLNAWQRIDDPAPPERP